MYGAPPPRYDEETFSDQLRSIAMVVIDPKLREALMALEALDVGDLEGLRDFCLDDAIQFYDPEDQWTVDNANSMHAAARLFAVIAEAKEKK